MTTLDVKRLNEVVKAFSGLNWQFVGEIEASPDSFRCWVKIPADNIILLCKHSKTWDAVRVTEPGLTDGLWDAYATGAMRSAAAA